MSELRKNDIIELDITDINNLGCGVARLPDGRVVFVNGAVTGERIRAKLIKLNTGFAVGRLEEILTHSEMRHDGDDCRSANSCGGCVFRHIKYEYEKEIKQNYVRHAFLKAGLPEVAVGELHSTDGITAYRNKAQYPFVMTKEGVKAGFYAVRSHNVVPAPSCSLQPEFFGEILGYVCDFADRHGYTVYDEQSGKGLLRHLYLRYGQGTGEIMLCLVINGKGIPNESEFVNFINQKHPNIKSIYLNFNEKNTNVVLGKDYKLIFGRPYIEDALCGKRFRISPQSFYQINHDGCELLYGIARDKVLEGESKKLSVVDLYCGIGTIGLSMADNIESLVGLEIVESAVECAKENAILNGVKNASFYAGDAKDIEAMFESAEREHGKINPDVVILDPPRKGCTVEVLEFLSRRDINKIVYVSCDPDTLARDCAIMKDLGYTVGKVEPVDMFPRTGHVESVVMLCREKKEHQMNLNPEPFKMIKSGKKTIELRLYDEKRQAVKIGDTIVFTNIADENEKLRATVLKLHIFKNFEELYNTLPLLKCGYTEEDVSTAHFSDMEAYYSADKQKQYGVVGIEILKIL